MLEYDIKSAHRMVREQRALPKHKDDKSDVRWEGWDIVFFRPADHAIHSRDGAFRNGVWGFDNRVSVNSEGKWLVDARNIKRIRRSKSRPR